MQGRRRRGAGGSLWSCQATALLCPSPTPPPRPADARGLLELWVFLPFLTSTFAKGGSVQPLWHPSDWNPECPSQPRRNPERRWVPEPRMTSRPAGPRVPGGGARAAQDSRLPPPAVGVGPALSTALPRASCAQGWASCYRPGQPIDAPGLADRDGSCGHLDIERPPGRAPALRAFLHPRARA